MAVDIEYYERKVDELNFEKQVAIEAIKSLVLTNPLASSNHISRIAEKIHDYNTTLKYYTDELEKAKTQEQETSQGEE